MLYLFIYIKCMVWVRVMFCPADQFFHHFPMMVAYQHDYVREWQTSLHCLYHTFFHIESIDSYFFSNYIEIV